LALLFISNYSAPIYNLGKSELHPFLIKRKAQFPAENSAGNIEPIHI
jgi:hypothetical protein